MPHTLDPFRKKHALSFEKLFKPADDAIDRMSPLKSQCDRPLKMNFEDLLAHKVLLNDEYAPSYPSFHSLIVEVTKRPFCDFLTYYQKR